MAAMASRTMVLEPSASMRAVVTAVRAFSDMSDG
jgi:hypothetical protein